MGAIKTFRPNLKRADKQLTRFKALLDRKPILKERKDVLSFFKKNEDLAGFLGTYHPDIAAVDQIAHEYPIFNSFHADLVVADSANAAYCFVEFENAAPDSIFKKYQRTTTYWTPRFLEGFSQLVDWFGRLEDEASTGKFSHIFGSRQPRLVAMLVIGRDHHLSSEDKARLEWWRANVQIAKRHVYIRTFDELYRDLARRILVVKNQAAAYSSSQV